MTWPRPSDFERSVREEVGQRWPEILPLARVVSLALRVEPLLLRNARMRFVDRNATELESLLWFSPLVAARGTREVVLHGGVARLLADELRGDDPALFDMAWACTLDHTGHWPAEDRLEQDLRYRSLLGDRAALAGGLRDMLRRIHLSEDEGARVNLARWVRHALPPVAGDPEVAETTRLLSQFVGQALGVGMASAHSEPPAPLPEWLAARLPPPYKPARLGVELRYDAEGGRQVLHCIEPAPNGPAVEFSTALPGELHVQCDDAPGARHRVAQGTRIALPLRARRVLLTTLEGRRYELTGERPPEAETPEAKVTPEIYLTHVPADAGQAGRIAEWLAAFGISVRLMKEDKAASLGSGEGPRGAAPVRLLRLWTRIAQRYWSDRGMPDLPTGPASALLRAEPVDTPSSGAGAEQLLDIFGWDRSDAVQAERMLSAVKAWLGRGEAPSGEVQRLLAELDDPETTPPRRLEIGDRLAELGDPREGVGVREFVIEEPATDDTSAEVQALLQELEDASTEPPRRLAIGDRLAELGDPREGVGLDSRGLPRIAWVEIPGGEFVYQGQKATLPAFRIARYPVTNLQYQAFVDAGGYQDPRWWTDLEKPAPSKLWPQANRPRTNVSWYEAVAFCHWLSAQLSYEVRLPTEQEWERAAAGVDGRGYPWGVDYREGYANVDEKSSRQGRWYLDRTTAVGIYPQGRSQEGVLDLAGNVWEWCLNRYDKPELIDADTSGSWRVLRGGSWGDVPGLARAGLRDRDLPDVRNKTIGCRVLSSAPMV